MFQWYIVDYVPVVYCWRYLLIECNLSVNITDSIICFFLAVYVVIGNICDLSNNNCSSIMSVLCQTTIVFQIMFQYYALARVGTI